MRRIGAAVLVVAIIAAGCSGSSSSLSGKAGPVPSARARVYIAPALACNRNDAGASFTPLAVSGPTYATTITPTQGCRENRSFPSYVFDVPIPSSGTVSLQPGNQPSTALDATRLGQTRSATIFYAREGAGKYSHSVIEYRKDRDLDNALGVTATPTTVSTTAANTHVTRPRDHLTGIGATRMGFVSAHTPDPDPRAAPGCCFLPKITNSGASSPQDEYGPVQYGDGYVVNESINFDTGTLRAAAMALASRDLPSDARLVRTRRAYVCIAMLYRSHALHRQTHGLGSYVAVSLYGRFDGPYDPNDVELAILSTQGDYLGRC